MRDFINSLISPFHDFRLFTPAAPATDVLRMFAGKKSGRMLPRIIGPSGLDTSLQPNLFSNKVGRWNPAGGSTTLPGVDGFAAPTPIGTVTSRPVASTNMITRVRRLGYAGTAAAGIICGHYSPVMQFTIGATGDVGGFFYCTRFIPADPAAVAGARMFIGLRNSAANPANIEPNTQINCVGVAQLSTSNNLQLVSGGSAAQAAIDLGVNFPANGLSTDLYELALFAPPNTQVIHWQVTRLNTGHVASGTLNGAVGTAIPAASVLLGHTAWRCNNATLLACGLDIASIYIETDN
jgi:hypothetical protein